MIIIKNDKQIESMRSAGRIAALALKAGGEAVRPGLTTAQLDRIISHEILRHGATPSFLGYGGFPASACISVNNEVIHGIPGSRQLSEGDLVSIDVGAYFQGFHGDTAATFPVGIISEKDAHLIDVTRKSLAAGIQAAKPGARIGDISFAVQSCVEAAGCSVVRRYVGHGVGASLHEEPEVPNFGRPDRGPKLLPGMVIAIEPMVNAGGWEIEVLEDDWTVITKDGTKSAHFEHTVLITDKGAQPLTICE